MKGKFQIGGSKIECKSLFLNLKKVKNINKHALEKTIIDLVDKEIILMKPETLDNVLRKNYGIKTININYSFYCIKLQQRVGDIQYCLK